MPEEKTQAHKSIKQIMSLIGSTTDPVRQDRLWKRVDVLIDKIAAQEDGLVCDACGKTFEPENNVAEQPASFAWISDDEGSLCPEHKTYHPDHVQVDYGRNILE